MTRAAAVLTSAHVFFEVAAGVGMPLASFVGPIPAAEVWAAATGTVWAQAPGAASGKDTVFATVNVLSLAACVAHLLAWPKRSGAVGLPWLVDCEGLGGSLMPAYNLLIYGGASTAIAALALENRRSSRWPPLAAFAAVPMLMAAQRAEFARLRQQARSRPAWWNRRLGSSS